MKDASHIFFIRSLSGMPGKWPERIDIMANDDFDVLEKALLESESVLILPHLSIDGDSLGSSLALAMTMLKKGKTVKILAEKQIPDFLSFLPQPDGLIVEKLSDFRYDLCVAIDCGNKERFLDRIEYFDSAKHTMNIDHHSTNDGYAELNRVEHDKAAACEIIYNLIDHMHVPLDIETATCLYVGLSTDTGGFRYSNTRGHTLHTAARLVDTGIDVGMLSDRIFEYNNKEHFVLLSVTLQNMELYYDETFAISTISIEDFKNTGACDADAEGIVNYGRKIKTVDVSVLMRQKEDGSIRVNLRSSQTDVSIIAAAFNGGGHKNAAGCTLDMPLYDAKKVMIERFSFLKER